MTDTPIIDTDLGRKNDEQYSPKKIKSQKKSERTISINGHDKVKTVETTIYENGVKKNRLKQVKKDGKTIFQR